MRLSEAKLKDRVRSGSIEGVVIGKIRDIVYVGAIRDGVGMRPITNDEREQFALAKPFKFVATWTDSSLAECEIVVPKKPIPLSDCKLGDRVRFVLSAKYVQGVKDWKPDTDYDEVEGTLIGKRGSSYTIGWGDVRPVMANTFDEVEDLTGHKYQSNSWGSTCACYLIEEPPSKLLKECSLGDEVEIWLDDQNIPTNTKTSKVLRGVVFARYKSDNDAELGVGGYGTDQGFFRNARNGGTEGFDYISNEKDIKFSTWVKADTQVRVIAEAPKVANPKPVQIDPKSMKNGDKFKFEFNGKTYDGVMLCPDHCSSLWVAVDRAITISANWNDPYHKKWSEDAEIDTSKYGVKSFHHSTPLKVLSVEPKKTQPQARSSENIAVDTFKALAEAALVRNAEQMAKEYHQITTNFDAFAKAMNKQMEELRADVKQLKLSSAPHSLVPIASLLQSLSIPTCQPGDIVSPVFDPSKLQGKVVGVISSAGQSLVLLGWKEDEQAPLEASLNYSLHSGETMSCLPDIHSYKHYLTVMPSDLSLLKVVAVAPEDTIAITVKHGGALAIKIAESSKPIKSKSKLQIGDEVSWEGDSGQIVGVITSASGREHLLTGSGKTAGVLSNGYLLQTGEKMVCLFDVKSFDHYTMFFADDPNLSLVSKAPTNLVLERIEAGHPLSSKTEADLQVESNAGEIKVEAATTEAAPKDKSSGLTTAMMIGGTMLGALASAMVQGGSKTGVRVSDALAEPLDDVVETIAEVANA